MKTLIQITSILILFLFCTNCYAAVAPGTGKLVHQKIVEIGSEEIHAYEIKLDEGQIFNAVFLQEGIELLVAIRSESNQAIKQRKVLPLLKGKWISFAAQEAGTYTLNIAPRYLNGKRGSYQFLLRKPDPQIILQMSNPDTELPKEKANPFAPKLAKAFRQAKQLYRKSCGTAELEFDQTAANEKENFRDLAQRMILQISLRDDRPGIRGTGL